MKKVRGDLYVHRDYIDDLPKGTVNLVLEALGLLPAGVQWNIVRVPKNPGSVSFLHYPRFFEDPHPALACSVRVDIASGEVSRCNMSQTNPPILHRKETFLNPTHPRYETFRRLTEQEEERGLYEPVLLHKIGRKRFWQKLLQEKGLAIRNHSLFSVRDLTSDNQPSFSSSSATTAVQLRLFGDTSETSGERALHRSSITALHRKRRSLPAVISVEEELLHGRVFDWGCGKGRDILFFREQGFEAEGWDPAHKTDRPPESFSSGSFHWVQNVYVLNTMSDRAKRDNVIRDIFEFLPVEGHLYIGVRSAAEIKRYAVSRKWQSFGDGWITGSGSFQKGFTVQELTSILHSHGFEEIKTVREQPVILLATKL